MDFLKHEIEWLWEDLKPYRERLDRIINKYGREAVLIAIWDAYEADQKENEDDNK